MNQHEHEHEQDRAAAALRAAFAVRAAAYEPVAVVVPARRRRWALPVGAAAGAASVALAAAWVLGPGASGPVPPASAPPPPASTAPVPPTEATTPPFEVGADGEPVLACANSAGGATTSPEAMDGALDDQVDRAEVVAGLERLVAEPPDGWLMPTFESAPPADLPWRVLWLGERDGTEQLLLGVGRWSSGQRESGSAVAWFERRDDGWWPTATGSCDLGPVARDGLLLARLGTPGGPAQRGDELTVTVREEACTGGRSPAAYLTEPWVVETATTVTVYWATEHGDGVSTCPGNEAEAVTLQLGEPLGDRVLLDGSLFPPAQVLPAP